MSKQRIKISKKTQKILDEIGKENYRLEPGSRHIRLFIKDTFVTILPRGLTGDGHECGRGELNSIAHIRRMAKELLT